MYVLTPEKLFYAVWHRKNKIQTLKDKGFRVYLIYLLTKQSLKGGKVWLML